MTGLRDADLDRYYGGLVYVYEGYAEGVDYDNMQYGGTWLLTVDPQGPLIDGSTVETFTRVSEFGQIPDVPVGVYTVAAGTCRTRAARRCRC